MLRWHTRPGRCRTEEWGTNRDISLSRKPILASQSGMISSTKAGPTGSARDSRMLGLKKATETQWIPGPPGEACSIRWYWWFEKLTFISSLVPFVAKQSDIHAGQERTDPKDQEDISKAIVDIGLVGLNANAEDEDKADEEGTPQIPFFETGDSLILVSWNQEDGVFDFGGYVEQFFFLRGCWSTRVSMESSSKASSSTW